MHSGAVRLEWTDVCAEIEAGLKRRVAPLPSAVPSAVGRKPRVRNAVGTGSRPVHHWQTSGGCSKDGCQDVQKKTKLMEDAHAKTVRMRQCAKVVSNERYYSHVGQ